MALASCFVVKPPRGLFNFGPSEGKLNREGGLSKKSNDKVTFGSFSVLLSHILQNQHTILRAQIHKFVTVFIPNHTKINLQHCVAK